MKLLSHFMTVGFATLLSRILGFLRDVLMAAFVGAGPVTDAFLVAFRLPNLFRRLFAEGAFNAAFIPLFARKLEEDTEQSSARNARQFASEILAVFVFTLIGLTILAEIAMPIFVMALAPGFLQDPQKLDLAVWLTRITFPYLFCMSLIAMLGGMLNTFGHFKAAAYGPILLNVIMVCVLAWIGATGLGNSEASGSWLAGGVLVAGFVQLGVLIIAFRRTGFGLRLQRPKWTPSVTRLLALGLPGAIAGGITQLNIFIGTIIASLQESAVSFLYYADRLYQFPLGIVGIAMGVVLLPVLSRHIRREEQKIASDTQNRALELALALTIPASVGLFIVPDDAIRLMFERGHFSSDDTNATAAALAAFATGLPAFVLIKVLSPGFFAREDTKTPMWFAGVSMIVNVSFSLILFPYLQHVGIAVATSVAGWVNAGLLFGVLWHRGYFTLDSSLKHRVPWLIVCSLLLGVWIYFLSEGLNSWLIHTDLIFKLLGFGILVATSVVLFGALCQLTHVFDIRTIFGRIRARGQR